jgi:hypothetical protein
LGVHVNQEDSLKPRTSILVPVLALIAAGITFVAAPTRAQSPDAIGLMAADVNIAGNSATAFGPVDGCLSVPAGSDFQVDFGVDAIPSTRPIVGFEFRVGYDPALVEIVASDNAFLLGSVGIFEPFLGVQDPLPDADGDFTVSVLDLASNDPPGANMESGPGVLTRITFRPKGAGQTAITIAYSTDPAAATIPAVIDLNSLVIPIERVQSGIVAIGQACPTTGGGEPVPPVDQPAPPYEDLPTPGPTANPNASPGPTDGSSNGGGGAPGETTPAASGPATPTRTPSASVSPSPSAPATGGDDDDDGGTPLGAIILAVVVGIAGIAAAGAGAIFLVRRSRGGERGNGAASPPDGGTEPPPADGPGQP